MNRKTKVQKNYNWKHECYHFWKIYEKNNSKKEAIINLKKQRVSNEIDLNTGKNMTRKILNKIGVVKIHPKKGTHLFCYKDKHHFDSHGCAPPEKKTF